MDVPALAPQPSIRRYGWLVLPLAAAGALVVAFLSLGFLKDPAAPGKLFTAVYDAIGQTASADAIRERGLDPTMSKVIQGTIALTIGVGGVWLLYLGADAVVERLGRRWRDRILPYVFVGPAIALLSIYLIFPTVVTAWFALTDDEGGVANFTFALTDPAMLLAFRNNLIWFVLATGASVGLGLLIATLVDRIRYEALAKTFVFLPLAISLVGAGVIWRFVYIWEPPGEQQIGLVNAAVTAVGPDPVPWLQTPPVNTLALVVVGIWLYTGFCMVVLSSALKGVPKEIIEAARMDGATEIQLFFRIIVPSIRGTIITVATTTCIAVLKVFDIVFVMTGGKFETEVIANRMFQEMFKYRNLGHASALAIVLFIAVIPVMIVNVRNLNRQGIGR